MPSKEVDLAFSFIIALMCAEGSLIRAHVRGSWRSNLFEYARFDKWLPDLKLDSISSSNAQEELGRLYFRSYGPATLDDFRWWGGFSVQTAREVFEALDDELAVIQLQNEEANYYLLEEDLANFRSIPKIRPSGIALLPVWDAYMMAYQQRNRFLNLAWYDHVYDGGGNATSVILSDGQTAGLWDFEQERKRLIIKVFLFPGDGKVNEKKLATEVHQLAVDAADWQLLGCQSAPPLGKGSRSRFRSPLKGCEGVIIAQSEE